MFFAFFAGEDSLPTHGQTALLHSVKWQYDRDTENRYTHTTQSEKWMLWYYSYHALLFLK